MRGGDAKHRRAARLTTFADQPWSARASLARVPREAQYPEPSESAAFARLAQAHPRPDAGVIRRPEPVDAVGRRLSDDAGGDRAEAVLQ